MEELSQAQPGGEPERPQADAIWNIKVGPAPGDGAPVPGCACARLRLAQVSGSRVLEHVGGGTAGLLQHSTGCVAGCAWFCCLASLCAAMSEAVWCRARRQRLSSTALPCIMVHSDNVVHHSASCFTG